MIAGTANIYQPGEHDLPASMQVSDLLSLRLRVFPPALRAIQLHTESCYEHSYELNGRDFIAKHSDTSEDSEQLLDR